MKRALKLDGIWQEHAFIMEVGLLKKALFNYVDGLRLNLAFFKVVDVFKQYGLEEEEHLVWEVEFIASCKDEIDEVWLFRVESLQVETANLWYKEFQVPSYFALKIRINAAWAKNCHCRRIARVEFYKPRNRIDILASLFLATHAREPLCKASHEVRLASLERLRLPAATTAA